MEDKDLLKWIDEYSVGISYIDEQHKSLIDITNKLIIGCKQGEDKGNEAFKITIRSLVDYMKLHFKTEEDLLTKYNYPEVSFKEHKYEHEQFILKILEFVADFESGKKFIPNQVIRFLRNWISEHITTIDKKYSEFLQKNMKSKKY